MELLVVIVLLGVLLSLAIPAVRSFAFEARGAACLSNFRNIGVFVAAYANDDDDLFPTVGKELDVVVTPGGHSFWVGGAFGLSVTWALLFPDEWRGDRWNPGLRCSKQPTFVAGGDEIVPHNNDLPWTWWSSALWIDPNTLVPGNSFYDFKPKVLRVTDVWYPSRKSLAFEQIAFCTDGPGLAFWFELGQTQAYRSSTLLIDGSARRMPRDDGLPSVTTPPMDETVLGIHGLDLRN